MTRKGSPWGVVLKFRTCTMGGWPKALVTFASR